MQIYAKVHKSLFPNLVEGLLSITGTEEQEEEQEAPREINGNNHRVRGLCAEGGL